MDGGGVSAFFLDVFLEIWGGKGRGGLKFAMTIAVPT